jgi:hypothetical protein
MRKIFAALTIATLASISLAASPKVAGTWMVTKDGKPNPNMKLILSPKGTFKFAGMNYSSGGNYTVSDGTIQLIWTTVDGQKVKPGTMKKRLTISPENTFTIDQYTYARYK